MKFLLKHLLENVDQAQGVLDLDQGDLFFLGDLREAAVLVAVGCHDQKIGQRRGGVDHSLIVAPGRAPLGFAPDVDGDDQNFLLPAVLEELADAGRLALHGQA